MNNLYRNETTGFINKISADYCIREAGFVMPAFHCHTFYELFYVMRGKCRFTVEDKMYDLHEGDFLLIPPQVLHYTRYMFGSCQRYAVFFDRADLDQAVFDVMPGREDILKEVRILQVQEFHREEMEALLSKMVLEERIEDERSPLLLSILLQELFIRCSRVCSFIRDTPSDIHTTDRSILRAARYIGENYNRSIDTADIASAAGLSPNYLTKRFRAAAGIGLREYLIFIRLKHAAVELVSTNASITDIALQCGFSDGNYFKDVFKKKYGVSPRAYRKEKHEKQS